MDKPPSLKPLYWVGSSKRDLRSLPGPVVDLFGFALYLAQDGRKHEQAKPLSGFGSAGVLEVVEDWDRSTYRAVVHVRFEGAVFVLHIFQKKSKRGAATPKADIDLNPRASQSGGADRQGAIAMKKQRVVRGIPVEEGSGNVYTDLGYLDSESMLVKAQLAAKIAEIIQRRALTQTRDRGDPGANAAQGLRPPERAVSRDFGAPFVGMPDPIGPGCPHCDQADAPEPVEWPVDAFRSIGPPANTREWIAGAMMVPSRRSTLRRRRCFHLGPLLFEPVHPRL